jgi:outer membrane lipoprotein SlyB
MKLQTLTCVSALSALVLTGCVSPNGKPDNTGTGALAGGAVGATSGAVIGGSTGHPAEGALIGAAAGVIAGGLIGHSLDQEQQARLAQQSPQTYQHVDQGQPLTMADVAALAHAGVSDDVIINQIKSTHTIYHLAANDIIALHSDGVSEKVLNFMINTPNTITEAPAPAPATAVVPQAPPPPPTETVVVAPGPGYVWISGEWVWNGGWVWVGGHWVYPPHPHFVWVPSHWVRHGPHTCVGVQGHWG